ncbi:MarR family winged helix-turn-helix transcriptional regulator [Brevibacillus choshinensis]|nr:MarR family transcriptional regulator [Brevibacillus choshinensis]
MPSRKEILASLLNEMRRLSTATVLMHQSIADHLGLNSTDHKCLDFILNREPMTAGQLSELTNLTTGAVTGVIDRLERAGYVQRVTDPKDRRRIYIQPIHEKAYADIEPLFRPISDATIQMCSRYSEQELMTIVDFAARAVDLSEAETARIRSEGKKN